MADLIDLTQLSENYYKFFNFNEIDKNIPNNFPLEFIFEPNSIFDNMNNIYLKKLFYSFNYKLNNKTNDLTIVLLAETISNKVLFSIIGDLIKIKLFKIDCIICSKNEIRNEIKTLLNSEMIVNFISNDFNLDNILEISKSNNILITNINYKINESHYKLIYDYFDILRNSKFSLFKISSIKYIFYNKTSNFSKDTINYCLKNFENYSNLKNQEYKYCIENNKQKLEIVSESNLKVLNYIYYYLDFSNIIIIIHNNLNKEDRLFTFFENYPGNNLGIEINIGQEDSFEIKNDKILVGKKYIKLIFEIISEKKKVILFNQSDILEYLSLVKKSSSKIIFDFRILKNNLNECIEKADIVVYSNKEEYQSIKQLNREKEIRYIKNKSENIGYVFYETINYSDKDIIGFRRFKTEIVDLCKKDIYILLPAIPWKSPLFQRHQQMAKAMSKLNYLVIYVSLFDNIDNLSENIYKNIGSNLWITNDIENMLLLEKCFYSFFSPISKIGKMEIKLEDYYNKIKNSNSYLVYEYIDTNDSKISGSESKNIIIENNFNKAVKENYSDLIITTANSLYNEVISYNSNVVMIKNGVNFEEYQDFSKNITLPPNYISFCNKYDIIVGYFGAVAGWLDYNLLYEIIRENSNIGFIMIGPNYHIDSKIIPKFPNFFRNEFVPYDELKYYANKFTFCLLPFEKGKIAETTSPLKLYEYFALGKPVIATSYMNECMLYPEVFRFTNDEEFKQCIKEAKIKMLDIKFINRMKELAKENDWINRAKILKEYFKKLKNNNNYHENIKLEISEFISPTNGLDGSNELPLSKIEEVYDTIVEEENNEINEIETKTIDKTILETLFLKLIEKNEPTIKKPEITFKEPTIKKPEIVITEPIRNIPEIVKKPVITFKEPIRNKPEVVKKPEVTSKEPPIKKIDVIIKTELEKNEVKEERNIVKKKCLVGVKTVLFDFITGTYKNGITQNYEVVSIRLEKNIKCSYRFDEKFNEIVIMGCSFQKCKIIFYKNNEIINSFDFNTKIHKIVLKQDFNIGDILSFTIDKTNFIYFNEFSALSITN
jgi:hypothetical protein